MEREDSDSEGFVDFDDESSSGGFDDDDSSGDMAAFDGGSSDSNMLEEPGFTRMTSKQIGREYTPMIIDKDRLFSVLQSKLVEVKDRFEYISLDQGFILENLRKNCFLVEDTCNKLQEKVLVLMDQP
jgi:hypothetical protein